jgi:hypothetical protein
MLGCCIQAMNGELATQATITDGLDGKLLRYERQHLRTIVQENFCQQASARRAVQPNCDLCFSNGCAAELEIGLKN